MRDSSLRNVNIALALQMLCHIARNSGVQSPDLCDALGISRPTVYRLMAALEEHLGASIRFNKGRHGHGGEYSIESWGVLDETKTRNRFK